MTDEKHTASESALKQRHEQYLEVNSLFNEADRIRCRPFGVVGVQRAREFARRVMELIGDYWKLKDENFRFEKIFAESGSPLESASEDYRECRRMQKVLARALQEERDDHALTRASSATLSMIGERNEKIESLEATIEQLTKDILAAENAKNRAIDMFGGTEKVLEETKTDLLNREREIRELEAKTAKLLRTFAADLQAEIHPLQDAVAELDHRIGELKTEATKLRDEIEVLHIEAVGHKQDRDSLKAGNEELIELTMKLADRCAGQSQILSNLATRKK